MPIDLRQQFEGLHEAHAVRYDVSLQNGKNDCWHTLLHHGEEWSAMSGPKEIDVIGDVGSPSVQACMLDNLEACVLLALPQTKKCSSDAVDSRNVFRRVKGTSAIWQ